MPGFCVHCGAPLSSAFCTRCGQRVQPPVENSAVAIPQAAAVQSQPAVSASGAVRQSQPATQPQQTAPASHPSVAVSAPPASSAPRKSGAGKALLIVGAIILVLCLSAFGAVIYGVHWVRGKVSSITGGDTGGVRQVAQGNACSLLSPQELQQVLGVTIEKSSEIIEGNEPGCAYYTNPAAFADLQKIAIEQARRDSERVSKDPALKNSKNDNPLALLAHTEEMEGMVKGFGLSQPDKDGKVFAFTINRSFGADSWGTLRSTLSIVPGFKEVDGVGDHAMIGSFGHAFYVLKGDTVFTLNTMYVPETRVRGAELGRKLVAHY